MPTAPRCVLVDDDASVVSMVGEFLRGICPQLDIVSFSSGRAALAYLVESEADLVITDFRMPEMDGLQLTRHLRSRGKLLPIVVMSGNAVASESLAAGANAFISKTEVPGKLRGLLSSLGVTGVRSLPPVSAAGLIPTSERKEYSVVRWEVASSVLSRSFYLIHSSTPICAK